MAERTGGQTRRVVVGVDGSVGSRAALAKIAELAGPGTDSMYVVGVFVRHTPWLAYEAGLAGAQVAGEVQEALDKIEESARRDLESFLADHGFAGRLEIREGDPAHELVEVAQQEDAVGVVVGSHRHNPLSSVVLGSVASRLVHYSPVSVFVVRPTQ
jgi:nucleotide-binding universal stress UspA family protein